MTLAHLSAKEFVIVLDPGHGGKDPGAIGKISKEKDLNLTVAKLVGKMLTDSLTDVKIIYTRSTDVFIPLEERANIANKAKADLFLSIHTNAALKSTAYGTETYTLGMHRTADNLEVAKRENSVVTFESNYEEKYLGYDPSSSEYLIMFEFMQDKYIKESVNLANLIQKQYKFVAKRSDRGVYQAGFVVLRATSMPSVLTEIGYISNPDEERYLNTEEGQHDIAKSIVEGIVKYKNRK